MEIGNWIPRDHLTDKTNSKVWITLSVNKLAALLNSDFSNLNQFSLGEQLVRSDSHSTKGKASTHSWKRLEDAMQILVNTTDKPVFNNDVLRSSRLAGMLTILARGWLASPSTGTFPTLHTLSIEMCKIAHKLTNTTFTKGVFLKCQRSKSIPCTRRTCFSQQPSVKWPQQSHFWGRALKQLLICDWLLGSQKNCGSRHWLANTNSPTHHCNSWLKNTLYLCLRLKL